MLDTNAPTQKQTDHFLHTLNSIFNSLPHYGLYLLLAIIAGFLLVQFIRLIYRILEASRLLKQKNVFLQLIPLAFTDKVPLANTELINVLQGLQDIRPLSDKLLRRLVVFSSEIVGTREEGVRFIISIPKKYRRGFEKQIAAAYKSNISFEEIQDYIPTDLSNRSVKIADFKQTGEFYYPLKHLSTNEIHDPSSYVAGAMTNLSPGEIMALQLVLTPIKIRHESIARNIMHKGIYSNNSGVGIGRQFLHILNIGIYGILDAILEGVGEAISGPTSYESRHPELKYQKEIKGYSRPTRDVYDLEKSVIVKLSEPQFRVSLRSLVITDNISSTKNYMNDIRSSLNSFSTVKQSLKTRIELQGRQSSSYRIFMFRHRLPSLIAKRSPVLCATEVSDLFHFPHSEFGRAGKTVETYSRSLQSSTSIVNKADSDSFDVILGVNNYHGDSTLFGLTAEERERHVFITGGTGNGKTTLMEYAILQDIKNGKGVAVIDPHGDLAEDLIRRIPENRIKDVIFFDPEDIEHPIGMNLLERSKGLSENESLLEESSLEESIISVIHKAFSEDDTGGSRIDDVLRNSIRAVFTTEDPTLLTIYKLLTNFDFRKKVTANIKDVTLKDYWTQVHGKAGNMQRHKMGEGVITKINRFQGTPPVTYTFGQPKSTINFDDIMDSGKILICKFAQGSSIGIEGSRLFGTTVLSKIQQAAYRRQSQNPEKRKPFYLYVDEFQNFSTPIFEQFLSQARKYKLFITIAEQSVAQQKDQNIIDSFFSNIGTFICFRSGSPKDESMLLPLFRPFIDEGEIARQDAYNFYCLIKGIKTQPPLSGTTFKLQDQGRDETAKKIVATSRSNYAGYPPVKDKKPKPVSSRRRDKDNKSDDSPSSDSIESNNKVQDPPINK